MLATILDWFAGNGAYMTLRHCMANDVVWIAVTVALDLLVAVGYLVIAYHWLVNEKRLEPTNTARVPLANLRNIFLFCGLCGYIFVPIKMVWPAWRLYDLFMVVLVYFTWRFALRTRELRVVYTELGKSQQLATDLEASRAESKQKSFFLNAVSHDLRTPLNGLTLQAAVAEMSVDNNDPVMLRETLSQMKDTARVAADLLNSLLELGRLDWAAEPHSLTDFLLPELIDDILSRSRSDAEAKGLTLNTATVPAVMIRSDRLKLTRILDNLMNNAIKFTQAGTVTLSAAARDASVTLSIADTGPGIADDQLSKLFEEFYQVENNERNHAKGFGLGLAIAKRLADQLGAKICVESKRGHGSRFSIVLPDGVSQATARPAADGLAGVAALASG